MILEVMAEIGRRIKINLTYIRQLYNSRHGSYRSQSEIYSMSIKQKFTFISVTVFARYSPESTPLSQLFPTIMKGKDFERSALWESSTGTF
jgi:hypothetical protein